MADVVTRGLALAVAVALLLATVRAVDLMVGPPVGRGQLVRLVLELVVLALAWLLVNSPVEGRILWSPLPRHGLTVADVLVVPPLLVAALLLGLRLRT